MNFEIKEHQEVLKDVVHFVLNGKIVASVVNIGTDNPYLLIKETDDLINKEKGDQPIMDIDYIKQLQSIKPGLEFRSKSTRALVVIESLISVWSRNNDKNDYKWQAHVQWFSASQNQRFAMSVPEFLNRYEQIIKGE